MRVFKGMLVFVPTYIALELLGPASGMRLPGESITALLFGRISFLQRTLPKVTVDWWSLGIAGIALVVFVSGLHRLATWYVRADPGKSEQLAKSIRWRFRWTASIAALVVIMFAAGVAMVGVAHQTAWMLSSRESALSKTFAPFASKANLKEIGRATSEFYDKTSSFPAGATFDEFGTPRHGWQVQLLPFLGQEPLFNTIDLDVAWDDARNLAAFSTQVPAFVNPAAGSAQRQDAAGYALTHYAANGWLMGGGPALKSADIKDGTSNTILAGDAAGNFLPWGHPLNWRDPMLGINKTDDGFGWPVKSDAGASFVFADGHVRFLSNSTDPKVLKALSTPNGGEPVDY